MPEPLETVATYSFTLQADMARLALEQEGITVFTADSHLVGTNVFLGNALGLIKLQVPRSQAVRATEILRLHPGLVAGSAAASADDTGCGESRCLSCGADLPEDSVRCEKCGWSWEDEAGESGD